MERSNVGPKEVQTAQLQIGPTVLLNCYSTKQWINYLPSLTIHQSIHCQLVYIQQLSLIRSTDHLSVVCLQYWCWVSICGSSDGGQLMPSCYGVHLLLLCELLMLGCREHVQLWGAGAGGCQMLVLLGIEQGSGMVREQRRRCAASVEQHL